MIINSKTTRGELWHGHFRRPVSSSFDGTLADEREKFIADALMLLRLDYAHAEGRDLISDLVKAVSLNGRWPEGEPDQTIRDLIECATRLEGGAESTQRRCVTILQAFLLEFADRIERGDAQFSCAADLLVGAIIEAIEKDVEHLKRNLPSDTAYRLALMLAPNFSAIPSRKQRSKYIKLLRQLVRSESSYNHPFLEDLVLIYEKMDLEHLGALMEGTSASG